MFGTKLYCIYCGQKLVKNQKFCGNCGNQVDGQGVVADKLADPKATGTKLKKEANYSWTAGLIVTVVTAAVASLSLYLGEPVLGYSPWSFVDASLFAGLSYGAYRKSNFFAVGLLVLYLLEVFYQWATTQSFAGVIVQVLLIWYFYKGADAIIKLNKLQRVSK
jgi:hypothetical protein